MTSSFIASVPPGSPILLDKEGIDEEFIKALLRCGDRAVRELERSRGKPELVLTTGSQVGCSGEFDESDALATIRMIHEKMHLYELVRGVSLDETRLASPRLLLGGTCTAICLLVASKFLELQKSLSSTFTIFEDCIIDIIEEHALRSNKDFRAIQAAFNTIIVPETCVVTPADKIKLLAIRFDMRSTAESEVFDSFAGDFSSSEGVKSFLESDGVYVARAIKDPNILNKDEMIKQECKGHTTLIMKQTIKAESRVYLYDPNCGIKITDYTHELGEQILNFQRIIADTHDLKKFQIVKFADKTI